MAFVNIVTAVIPAYNEGVKVNALAPITSVTDGALVDFTEADQKVMIFVKNNGAAVRTVTFKHGDALQSVEDKTFSIPAGETWAFAMESGQFKVINGENKGKVRIVGESTDIQIQAVARP